MKLMATGMMTVALLATMGRGALPNEHTTPSAAAVDRGARWLASVQGADGGWGQDGGQAAFVRAQERLESGGNDVANTAVAAMALLRAGPEFREHVERAVGFVLEEIEASPAAGLAVTDVRGTQIQRKLGPYIDTFFASMLLTEVDGRMSTESLDRRVRRALEKVVGKIQRNQGDDGSWNIDGGWAPVLGTSMASRSLFAADALGVDVDEAVLDRADDYTKTALGPMAAVGGLTSTATAEAAGVPLYQSAQALEQLSRTAEDRERNAAEIDAIRSQLSESSFVEGFGSVGGEEYFSYLNVVDALGRTGGEDWDQWRSDIARRILAQQNADGSWAGHHCITGRVAVTSGAILNLTAGDHAG